MIGANRELTFILVLSKVHTIVCAFGFSEHHQEHSVNPFLVVLLHCDYGTV